MFRKKPKAKLDTAMQPKTRIKEKIWGRGISMRSTVGRQNGNLP